MSKTIDLRHVPRTGDGRIALGESGGNVTLRHETNNVTSHEFVLAPVHIRQRIWEFVSLSNGAVSRAMIAKGLKIKKTPWLFEHVESLVREGWLTRSTAPAKNGVMMYFYEVRK